MGAVAPSRAADKSHTLANQNKHRHPALRRDTLTPIMIMTQFQMLCKGSPHPPPPLHDFFTILCIFDGRAAKNPDFRCGFRWLTRDQAARGKAAAANHPPAARHRKGGREAPLLN